MKVTRKVVAQAVEDLPEFLLEDAIADFLAEYKLVGEVLVWIKKWKRIKRIKEIVKRR